MKARIYQPAKTATSSGRRKTRSWVLEIEPTARKQADSLIGWIGSGDTDQQVQMHFPTKEAALAFCERNALEPTVSLPQQRVVKPKSYADNFTGPV